MMQPILEPDIDHLVLDFKARYCRNPSVSIISGDAETVRVLLEETLKLAPGSIANVWPDHARVEMDLELLKKVYHSLWDVAGNLGWFPSMYDDDRGNTIDGRVWFVRLKMKPA